MCVRYDFYNGFVTSIFKNNDSLRDPNKYSLIRLALEVPTCSVQKDGSNVAQSSLDPGFLGVISCSSGSSGSLDLGSLGVVLLCFALLCIVKLS